MSFKLISILILHSSFSLKVTFFKHSSISITNFVDYFSFSIHLFIIIKSKLMLKVIVITILYNSFTKLLNISLKAFLLNKQSFYRSYRKILLIWGSVLRSASNCRPKYRNSIQPHSWINNHRHSCDYLKNHLYKLLILVNSYPH